MKSTNRMFVGLIRLIGFVCFATVAHAQEVVLVSCDSASLCSFRKVAVVTVQAKTSVLLASLENAKNPKLLRSSRHAELKTISGLYRETETGFIRVRDSSGKLGDLVLPSQLPKSDSFTPASAWTGVSFEYAETPKAKAKMAIPADQFVAFIIDPKAEDGAVGFLQNELKAAKPHPKLDSLIAGLLRFVGQSDALRGWREQLRTTMRDGLAAYKNERGDPSAIEAALDRSITAMNVYSRVAAADQQEVALRAELIKVRSTLTERMAIAAVLQKSGLDDAYLGKMDQLGLASWSRPALRTGLAKALLASSKTHSSASVSLKDAKQYEKAVEEAGLASQRFPCDPKLQSDYYLLRTEFVQNKAIPAAKPYAGDRRSSLEQIVRELSGVNNAGPLSLEQKTYFRGRIADGENIDKDYLPLLLRKAEFLKNVGELTAAREVVIQVETTVVLDQSEAKAWLNLDADLNTSLAITRQTSEKKSADAFANASFKDVLSEAEIGLRADPGNVVLLYRSALAAAILRDDTKAQEFVSEYLRSANPICTDVEKGYRDLVELYSRHNEDVAPRPAEAIPHWMSGQPYVAGSVFYDPLSGGFTAHLQSSATKAGVQTAIFWDGFMATSITTSRIAAARSQNNELLTTTTPLFVAEPIYDRQNFRMTAIGTKASSPQDKGVVPLRYLNSPEFDARLAAKQIAAAFPGTDPKPLTRGWAGNPFFHPFLWVGIFVFDFQYDELGRIQTAIPVTVDASRPKSPFSETLKFTWDGTSNRLLSIKGASYSRTMAYDKAGRLISEAITYSRVKGGKGTIKYSYIGDTSQLKVAVCEDNFFDGTERTAIFSSPTGLHPF